MVKKQGALEHRPLCLTPPPSRVSNTNVQVNFSNFARHNCVRINNFFHFSPEGCFFFFPAEGGGGWMIMPLKSGGEEERINLSEPRLYLFLIHWWDFWWEEAAWDGSIMDSSSRAPRITFTCLPVWGAERTAFFTPFFVFSSLFLIFTDMLQFPRFHQCTRPAATTALATHFHLTFSSYLRACGKKTGKKIHQAASGC